MPVQAPKHRRPCPKHVHTKARILPPGLLLAPVHGGKLHLKYCVTERMLLSLLCTTARRLTTSQPAHEPATLVLHTKPILDLCPARTCLLMASLCPFLHTHSMCASVSMRVCTEDLAQSLSFSLLCVGVGGSRCWETGDRSCPPATGMSPATDLEAPKVHTAPRRSRHAIMSRPVCAGAHVGQTPLEVSGVLLRPRG